MDELTIFDLRSKDDIKRDHGLVGEIRVSKYHDNSQYENVCEELSNLMKKHTIIKIDIAFDPYHFNQKGGESK